MKSFAHLFEHTKFEAVFFIVNFAIFFGLHFKEAWELQMKMISVASTPLCTNIRMTEYLQHPPVTDEM